MKKRCYWTRVSLSALCVPFSLSLSRRTLYPFLHLLPDGNLSIFANRRSILFDCINHRITGSSFPDSHIVGDQVHQRDDWFIMYADFNKRGGRVKLQPMVMPKPVSVAFGRVVKRVDPRPYGQTRSGSVSSSARAGWPVAGCGQKCLVQARPA
ncbi:hypothetical protein YC2023_121256 [Brassica napus]